MKQEWEEDSNISEAAFTLTIEGKCYSVTISSPLLVLFHDKRAIHCVPPLHIAVQFEDSNRKKKDKKAGGNLQKGLNELIEAYMSQDQASSESSTSRSSPIKAAESFVENNFFSEYRDIFIAFLLVLLGCLVAILLTFLLTSLEWDNTSVNNNPISDIVKSVKLNGWLFKSLNIAADINAYRQGGLNTSKVHEYYGTTDYEGTARALIGNYSTQYQSFLRGITSEVSEVLKEAMSEIG